MNSEFVSATQEFPFLSLKLAIYLEVNYVILVSILKYLEQELADYHFDWAIWFFPLGTFFFYTQMKWFLIHNFISCFCIWKEHISPQDWVSWTTNVCWKASYRWVHKELWGWEEAEWVNEEQNEVYMRCGELWLSGFLHRTAQYTKARSCLSR